MNEMSHRDSEALVSTYAPTETSGRSNPFSEAGLSSRTSTIASEISRFTFTKLDVISLVCKDGNLYHCYEKITGRGRCICCNMTILRSSKALRCKICFLKLHKHCENYRENLAQRYYRLGSVPEAEQNTGYKLILSSLVCKRGRFAHSWRSLWVTRFYRCNICGEEKPSFYCSSCDLVAHTDCKGVLNHQLRSPWSQSLNAGAIAELSARNLELKHRFLINIQAYLAARDHFVANWDTFCNKLRHARDHVSRQPQPMKGEQQVSGGDSKNYTVTDVTDLTSQLINTSLTDRILHPVGGVSALKSVTNLNGAYASLPGSGRVSAVIKRDLSNLQQFALFPEQALRAVTNQNSDTDDSLLLTDLEAMYTAQTPRIKYRAACTNSPIHADLQITGESVDRLCAFCQHQIRRRPGYECAQCGTVLHVYCEAYRIDKLKREQPHEIYANQFSGSLEEAYCKSFPDLVSKLFCHGDRADPTPRLQPHKLAEYGPRLASISRGGPPCLMCGHQVKVHHRGARQCGACGRAMHRSCHHLLQRSLNHGGNYTRHANIVTMGGASAANNGVHGARTESLPVDAIASENKRVADENAWLAGMVAGLEELAEQERAKYAETERLMAEFISCQAFHLEPSLTCSHLPTEVNPVIANAVIGDSVPSMRVGVAAAAAGSFFRAILSNQPRMLGGAKLGGEDKTERTLTAPMCASGEHPATPGSQQSINQKLPSLKLDTCSSRNTSSDLTTTSCTTTSSGESSSNSSQDISDLAEELSSAARKLTRECGSLAAKNLVFNQIPVTLNRIQQTMEQRIPAEQVTEQVERPLLSARECRSARLLHEPMMFASTADEGTLCYEMCCAMSNAGATVRTKEDIVVWD